VLKPYAVFILVLGIVSQGVAVWGTWVTLTLVTELISTESYQLDYWVGLVFFWVIGIVGIASGVGMLRHNFLALRLWGIFSWAVMGAIVLWAVLDAFRSDLGIDNLIEVVFFGAIAVLATLVWRQEKYRAAT
jgi:hypothetical protein